MTIDLLVSIGKGSGDPPSPDPASGLYGSGYYKARRTNAPERQRAYWEEYRRIIQRLNFRTGFVLDYGCGTGEFTDLFVQADWIAFGVEVSGYARQICEKKGITMAQARDLAGDSFDLVVFRGVLQHIDEPFAALREAVRVLKPGGMLAILAQPDADSLCYKLFGELPALDPPRNWWIPGAREITNILNKLGFGQVEILRPYWGGPYARPVRDFSRFVLRLFGVRRPFAFPGNMIEIFAFKQD